jgi:hypothetical protein
MDTHHKYQPVMSAELKRTGELFNIPVTPAARSKTEPPPPQGRVSLGRGKCLGIRISRGPYEYVLKSRISQMRKKCQSP